MWGILVTRLDFVGTVTGDGTKTASNSYVQKPDTVGGEIIGNGSISDFTADNNAKTQSKMLALTGSDLGDSDNEIWKDGSSSGSNNYPYLEWQDSFKVDQGKPWEAPIPSPTQTP